MSYRCQITGKYSRNGEKLNKIIALTRPRTYMKWIKDEESNKWLEVEAGKGWEVVQEINCTEEGKKIWESWTQEDKDFFLKELNRPK